MKIFLSMTHFRLNEVPFLVAKLLKNELKFNSRYILILIRMLSLGGLLMCCFYYFFFEIWLVSLRSYIYENLINILLLVDFLFKFFLMLHLMYGLGSIVKDYIYNLKIKNIFIFITIILVFKLFVNLTNFSLLKFV